MFAKCQASSRLSLTACLKGVVVLLVGV
uniref:Uncharacterized protein n=1 Tax=Arundo donax TaxID=35708 RepID=A0A0A8YRM3_ARUDO